MSPATEDVVRRLRAALGGLSTTAVRRLEEEMPWFADLPAQERAWIAMIVQGGVANFVDWYAADETGTPKAAHEVFGAAPRAFAGSMSLARTVAMVRLAITVVEENLVEVLGPEDAAPVVTAVTRYGRELGFAIAEVYARAAEQRGAWDARLEALVVDSVLRGEADDTLHSRASALGWTPEGRVLALVGTLPETDDGIEEVRTRAAAARLHALCAVQGERLVVLLSGAEQPTPALPQIAEAFGPGPVVVGPEVETLVDVRRSAAAALAGHRAAPGWPAAPRVVWAEDLLPERVLAGDADAVAHLLEHVHAPLAAAGSSVLETVRAYFEHGGSLEPTARDLFVHVNTVRYRLRRAVDATGLDPTDPREAYTLRLALTMGRLQEPTEVPTPDL